MRAASYARVSTEEQARGLSLASQQEVTLAEIVRRGWTPTEMATDSCSGKSLRRPGLEGLLRKLKARDLDALVVSRLDRLTRSTLDFYDLLGQADREGWALVCLHPSVDMSDPMGRAMAGIAAVFAQLEREMISLRQHESVAARRAAGTYRYPAIPPATLARMIELRLEPMSYHKIVNKLNAEGYESPGGKQWSPATVRTVLLREGLPRTMPGHTPMPYGAARKQQRSVIRDDYADHGDEHEQDGPEDVAQVGEVGRPAEADQREQDEQDPEVGTVDVGEHGNHGRGPTLSPRRALSARRSIGR